MQRSMGGGATPCFAAALAAADERQPLWLHDRVLDEQQIPCRRTQRRWVCRAAGFVGLATGHAVAALLGIFGVDLAGARTRYREAPDIRQRAKAVLELLSLLSVDQLLVVRLLAVGSLTGLISPAFWWDPVRRVRLFLQDGMHWPGAGRGRPPPSVEFGSRSSP